MACLPASFRPGLVKTGESDFGKFETVILWKQVFAVSETFSTYS